ncbi:MAG: response regulator [Hahellaceae bacterium]|nr:response regulator [Hahellaceae bacterium]MCP5210111.1 response regulator [Hahellaceae bacterium]
MDLDISDKIKRKVIVIMDDQGSMRGVFQAYLRDMGFTTMHGVVDGAEGLKFLEANAVDLVICDWNMPKKTGLEVLQTIRACEDTRTLPFLMVTSSSELERVKTALSSGVSDYLIKPFQPLHFGQKVVALLTESTHKAKLLKRIRDVIVEETATVKETTLATAEAGAVEGGDIDDDLMVNTVLTEESVKK